MQLSLEKIGYWLKAATNFNDQICQSVCIDSRTLKPGALFVAIEGEKFDGHDFVEQAREKGAIACVVHKPIQTTLPTILVQDTRKALGEIAKNWRKQHHLAVIAVTGSCGKTTTKTMIANILKGVGPTIATKGTLNNEIGLPLTILQLTHEHRYAVLELGANHLGEIAYLVDIAKPDIAAITNAAAAHLEGFGSVDGVARAKSEIYQGLTQDGVAILNKDDAYADFWQTVIGERKKITFGIKETADFYAREICMDEQGAPHFILGTPIGEISIALPLIGKHHIANVLVAAAACYALGVSLVQIQNGLESLSPINKRLVPQKGIQGTRILDDSYNANPLSLYAALEVLAHYLNEKILILGDMNELGTAAEETHKAAGIQAKKLGINRLYTVGKLACFAAETFGDGAMHFRDKSSLIQEIKKHLVVNTTILVKGSRGAKMEEVVAALME